MTENAWKLIWHDEFNGKQIDLTKWQVQVGYTGASNSELQIYTDSKENIQVSNSCLHLIAQKQDYMNHSYTSARVSTKDMHSWKFGRIEASIKIPRGQGIWPAFWMLGINISDVGWPACGEIDIMENKGHLLSTVRGTIHGPNYARDDSIGKDYSLADQIFSDNFHIFAIEWKKNKIRWFVDNVNFNTLTDKDIPGDWTFNQPFYILLNLAVGGLWPGFPDSTTQFPQAMLVDYVRVYTGHS